MLMILLFAQKNKMTVQPLQIYLNFNFIEITQVQGRGARKWSTYQLITQDIRVDYHRVRLRWNLMRSSKWNSHVPVKSHILILLPMRWDTNAQWSSALGNQTWIERLRAHKNNISSIKHDTEILLGFPHKSCTLKNSWVPKIWQNILFPHKKLKISSIGFIEKKLFFP